MRWTILIEMLKVGIKGLSGWKKWVLIGLVMMLTFISLIW